MGKMAKTPIQGSDAQKSRCAIKFRRGGTR